MAAKNSSKKHSPVPPAAKLKQAVAPKATAVAAAAAATVGRPVPQRPAAPDNTAELIRGLRDPSADVAREAAGALGRAVGSAAAVDALIEVVTNADAYFHCVVRAAACASLGQLGDRRATPALAAAVRDTMAEASAEAVRALAALRDERAIGSLLAVLRNEQGYFLPVVRLAAVNALTTFRADAKIAQELQAIAANPVEDAVIRQAAGK